jgi:predicted outer membrane protein
MMLRFAPAIAALLAAASASAQQPGAPQAGSPQRPAQTTQNQGADQNQTENRNAQRPNATPGAAQSDPNQSVTPPRNEVPDQNRRGARQAGQRGNRQAQSGNRFDAHVADCLILGNQEEIALLKFGLEKTKSDQVKELAQSMIKDHEKAVSELREFASPQHANVELTADSGQGRDVATREARKVPAEGDDAQAQGGQNNLMMKMHRMAKRSHEECLALSKEELSKYDGHEFDQAFLGQQLGAHIGMLAKLKAAQEETSGELSQWTAKAQDTTKKHKDHLEKLMNELTKEAHSKK